MDEQARNLQSTSAHDVPNKVAGEFMSACLYVLECARYSG